MAELVFFCGTMDCGKSTLALQVDHTHTSRGRTGLLYTAHDRAGPAVLSSRLGLARAAREVTAGTDFWADVTHARTHGREVDYLVCDEAQFYTPGQVEQLAALVDDVGVDVFAFGIMSDFRTRLFPGSARLVELADRVQQLQVEALCWCGARATHNARTVDGVVVRDGDQVLVGDVAPSGSAAGGGAGAAVAGYEVLCRRHHRRAMTAATARAGSEQTLALDVGSAAQG